MCVFGILVAAFHITAQWVGHCQLVASASPCKRFCEGLSRVGGCTAGHGLAHLVEPAGPLDNLPAQVLHRSAAAEGSGCCAVSLASHTRTQRTPNSTNPQPRGGCTWQWRAVVWACPALFPCVAKGRPASFWWCRSCLHPSGFYSVCCGTVGLLLAQHYSRAGRPAALAGFVVACC